MSYYRRRPPCWLLPLAAVFLFCSLAAAAPGRRSSLVSRRRPSPGPTGEAMLLLRSKTYYFFTCRPLAARLVGRRRVVRFSPVVLRPIIVRRDT